MTTTDPPPIRPWKDLRTTGLLWLINAALLHPRGYALAMTFDADGKAVGWQLLGDGSEPWKFGDDIDEPFRNVEATLNAQRRPS